MTKNDEDEDENILFFKNIPTVNKKDTYTNK